MRLCMGMHLLVPLDSVYAYDSMFVVADGMEEVIDSIPISSINRLNNEQVSPTPSSVLFSRGSQSVIAEAALRRSTVQRVP